MYEKVGEVEFKRIIIMEKRPRQLTFQVVKTVTTSGWVLSVRLQDSNCVTPTEQDAWPVYPHCEWVAVVPLVEHPGSWRVP